MAVPLAIGRGSSRRWISVPIFLYCYVFRGTPLLVQLYLIYYGVVFVEGIQVSWLWVILEKPFVPALIAFTLNTAAYTTEIFRGAIKSTARGEIEAVLESIDMRFEAADRLLDREEPDFLHLTVFYSMALQHYL
jgi:arginine/ornithine transport system permease protein